MKIINRLIDTVEKEGEIYYAENVKCYVKTVKINKKSIEDCCLGCPGLDNLKCLLNNKCGYFCFIKI